MTGKELYGYESFCYLCLMEQNCKTWNKISEEAKSYFNEDAKEHQAKNAFIGDTTQMNNFMGKEARTIGKNLYYLLTSGEDIAAEGYSEKEAVKAAETDLYNNYKNLKRWKTLYSKDIAPNQ
jgi:hypothetical protein